MGTVVANEEVIDGKTERGGFAVVRKPMRQWMLKITAYADKLLADLDDLDWPKSIKQCNETGSASQPGHESRPVTDTQEKFDVFTTHPDTLFGATYVVMAPEHDLVEKITTPEQQAVVDAYIEEAAHKSDLDRQRSIRKKPASGQVLMRPTPSMARSCRSGSRIMCWQLMDTGDYGGAGPR